MANVFKPPYEFNYMPSVFLAGSIEMGKAVDWQQQVTDSLEGYEVDIFNPRRDDWDASWEQKISNPQFVEQVSWELNALEKADIILMYFAPGTMSPISLLEFGLYARTKKMIVVCPEGFWRKGNVDVVCEMYDVNVAHNLEYAIEALQYMIGKKETE